MFYFVLFFILACVHDWLTCVWLTQRELQRYKLTVLLSMLLETLTWLPILVAIQTQDYSIAVASVLGSGVGTALGLRRVKL
jgi:hypothetical protein